MRLITYEGASANRLIPLEPNGRKLAITGGTVFTATSGTTLAGTTVLVEGERITGVGPASEVAVPKDATVIDAHGHFVMPGLIDAHLHLTGGTTFDPFRMFLYPPAATRVIRAALDAHEILMAGFTTVRHLGHGSMDEIIGLRHAINERMIAGPRILISGWALSQSGGHGDPHIFPPEWTRQLRPRSTFADGPEECRRVVRENFGAGADLIKIYATEGGLAPGPDGLKAIPNFTRTEIEAITDEAHRRGARVAAHATSREGILNAVLGGVDTIEHGGDVGAHTDLLDLMAERGVILVPTLAIYYWLATKGEELGFDEATVEGSAAMLEVESVHLKKVHQHGVRIAAGTDTGNIAGRGENARELELLVEAGLTPAEALIAATRVGAQALGLEQHIGTLEPGKLADVLILDTNPLTDVTVLRKRDHITYIMQGRAPLSKAPRPHA